jgi:branched-chain amino acid transport system substrate-binding protein
VVVSVSGTNQVKLFSQLPPKTLEKQLWLLNEVDWPELYLFPGVQRPLFGTTWSWNLDTPGTAEFVAEYRKRYKNTKLDYPGDVVHSAYLATLALLDAVESCGSTNNHKVIKELEKFKWSAKERMQHDPAYMNAKTHHVQQSVYIARWNPKAKKTAEGIEIVGRIDPKRARSADEEKEAQLETFEETKPYAP